MRIGPLYQTFSASASRSVSWADRVKICAVAGALCVCGRLAWAQGTPVPVKVEKVVQRRVSQRQTFVGTAMPPRRSGVGSAVDGRLVELYVREGDAVQAGKPLAQLRTGTLEIELARARAVLELRWQQLAELENGSRPEEIERTKANVEGAKARSDYAQARLRRARKTHEKGAALTLDQLEEAVSRSVAAKQALLAVQADYQMAVKGPRKEQIAQATARVAVQNELIRQIKDRIALHTLMAPFDGYVVKRHNEIGGWASAGDPVVEIVELNPIEVEVFVSEEFVTHVHPGTKAAVTFDALPRYEFDSKIVNVVPQADVRSRTFPVRVQLANPKEDDQPLIKAGLFARVTLLGETRDEALMVPKDSLVLNGNQRVVYVMEPGTRQDGTPTVSAVSVELGISDGRWIEVIGGIAAGQDVVVRGNERLRPNQAVLIAP